MTAAPPTPTTAPAPVPAPPARGVAGFLAGAAYVPRGFRFLMANRRAWPIALIPALVNAVLLVIFGAVAWAFFDDLYALLLPDWAEATTGEGIKAWFAGAGAWMLRGIVGLGTFVLSAMGALICALVGGTVLAGPLQEMLSETVEAIALHEAPGEGFSWRQLVRDAARGATGAVGRLALWLVLYMPLAILSIIPVVGVVFAAGTVIYSAFFFGINFQDPIYERRKLPLLGKLSFAQSILAPHLGFGAASFALLLVPGAALFATPFLVTGGTLLFLESGGPALEDGQGGPALEGEHRQGAAPEPVTPRRQRLH